ncbi:MAG: DUF2911 domain-containing protein, partial [Oleiharenicola lentus]
MITQLLRTGLVATSGLCFAAGLFAQTPKIDFPAASPAATVTQRVGLTDIQVNYARPGAKGRKVFGGLVPYDHVWRTGANTATKISFSTPVKLNGTEIAAGTYELFTIPGATEWTVIIHKNMSQWGAYAYDEKNDVARIKATPVVLEQPIETLAFGFNDLRDESATMAIAWEKVRVPVAITVDVKSTLVPQIEAVMSSGGEKLPYFSAAMYYFENNIDLKKAAAWMDAAIAANPDAFYMVYRKALILEKMGDKAGAAATARKSLEAAQKDSTPA